MAHIAARELSPTARAQVQDLLGGDAENAMVQASTWADEIRNQRPPTAPWHFVDIPIGSTGYDARRDCPRGDCVVAQIERDERILADRTLLPPVRAEALRFLIHLVGDLHQPLRASDNGDRGGNEGRVVLGGRRTNLHAVWDTPVVQTPGIDAGSIAADLMSRITLADRMRWHAGDAADWANESWRVARDEIYAKLPGSGGASAPVILPAGYASAERIVVSVQLEKAGVRLGQTLNVVLSGERPSSDLHRP